MNKQNVPFAVVVISELSIVNRGDTHSAQAYRLDARLSSRIDWRQ